MVEFRGIIFELYVAGVVYDNVLCVWIFKLCLVRMGLIILGNLEELFGGYNCDIVFGLLSGIIFCVIFRGSFIGG